MNVKTLKRMSKRSVSVLLTVLMIISLFTVCMVGTTVTAGAASEPSLSTKIYLDASDWQSAHLFVGNGSKTTHYTLTDDPERGHDFSVYKEIGSDYDSYFFSNTDYGMVDEASNYVDISTVRNDLITGKHACSNLISKSIYEIKSDNVYKIGEDGFVDVDGSSIKNGWINATMYNYRTTNQIADANKTEGTLTEEQNYLVDSTNGQAKPIFKDGEDGDVYKQYNAAVADWFKNQSTNGKVKDVSVTPLYQGNIRAGNDLKDENGTLKWAKSYFNFVSVANGANRKDGAKLENKSIQSVAQGLVDSTLSKNGTIQQNGIELPQFSDAFMNFNADSKIQSKYENLKFEAKVIKSDNGNAWYKYDSSAFGNRSLDITDRQIKNRINEVRGCENVQGKQNDKAGYYPFNQSQPSDTDNITNCFGTRFDIDYAMPNKDGVVNDEQMQFKFTGDDDMWVYIDGHLVLDLGGSHAMASGSINLATMQVSYTSGYYDGTYDNDIYNNGTDRASASVAYTSEKTTKDIPENVKEILQDTTRTHKMTIFYMERGTFDSNLSFEFLLPQTNSLTVEQKIDTSAVNSALVKDTLQTADKDVFQTTIQSDSRTAKSNNTASVTEDFTRKDVYGNTQVLQKASDGTTQGTYFSNPHAGTFTSIGDTNFVWEDKNSTDTTKGKGTPTEGTVELLYNQSATFNDQFANGSKFKLRNPYPLKSFYLPNLTENQPSSSENGRNRDAYYDTKLMVTDNSGFVLKPSNGGAYNFGDSSDNIVKVKAEYTSKVRVGKVAFKKNIVDSSPNTTEVFKFKIEMRKIFGDTSDSEWKVYDGLNVTANGKTGRLGSDGTVQLKHGETLTIDGVPVGTEYRITEIKSGNYSVSSVVCDSTAANNSKMVSETNGFNAKLPTSGADQTASYIVNNTRETVTVLYRYQDRAVEKGLPTDLENHYTYFTRNIAGNINNIVDANDKLTPEGKEKLKNSLPEVSNVLMSYSVDENIQQNVDYIALTDDYLNEELGRLTDKDNAPTHEAEGVPADIKALVNTGKKVLVVTYDATQKNYTVNLTFPQLENDNYVVKTSSVRGPFNSLILTNAGSKAYTAPEKYTDADGKVHTFKYWAKRVAIEGGASSNKKWVPVSTNYTYNYRITDNMELKAVYDNTDEDYTKLDEPTVTADSTITYMPTGDGTGYAAAASERIYDSYSINDTDRTRVNVIFDAVGSADRDEGISALGYVLIKKEGSYANASEFTEADIRAALGSDSSAIKGYPAQIKYYPVDGRGNFNGTEYDQTGTKWNGRYNAGKVNLTNKNRANIVFDLKNTEASHNYYFTCYTVMKRGDYTYVSKSPAYFNLGEADPNVTPVTPTEDTYNISTSARYTTDNGTTYISDTKAGYVLSNGVRFVKEGQKITVSYYPTSYTENDRQYVSQLESLKIGKQTITSDDFASLGIDPTKNGSYQFTFSKEKYLEADAAAGATLEIVASFRANTDTNYITVTAPTVTNGTVKIGSEYTVQNDTTLLVKKDSWFYVKAAPAEGYGFTNWSVGETSVSTNPVRVVVDTDGTLSVDGKPVTMEQLTPNFVQLINVTLTSGTGGTISYSYNYNKAVSGTVAENSAKTVSVLPGTKFTLTANPKSGYNFTKWGEDGSALKKEKTVETTRFNDATITAEFERVQNKILYLKPGCNEWKNGTQRFYAYLFGERNVGSEWKLMEPAGDYLYSVEVPSNKNYTKVIFCKMKNDTSVGGWNSDVQYQTVDIDIPAESGKIYTVTNQPEGQSATGEWSAAPDDNTVTVKAPTVANGTVTIVTDTSTQELTTLTVPKGTPTSFYVKATANTGFTFKNWTVNGTTTINDNPVTVNVAEDGTLSVNGTAISSLDKLVPTFEGGTTGDTTTLYLVPNSNWKQDKARFAVYLFNPKTYTEKEMWLPMEKVNDMYMVDVPSKYDYQTVIFCRMNGDTTENNWKNRWNQSGDEDFPTGNETKFTVDEGQWGSQSAGAIGKWSAPQS